MVIERADLSITTGREAEFEKAMQQGCTLLAGATGCTGVALSRCIERPHRYELQIRWDSVNHHTEFTRTEDFKKFRELVGPFFTERPLMEHYQVISQTG